MATVRVEVTQGDIAQGLQSSPSACPVARALYRASGFAWKAAYPVLIRGDDTASGLPTPPRVADWMRRYDDLRPGGSVEPFAFNLDVPDEWLRRE